MTNRYQSLSRIEPHATVLDSLRDYYLNLPKKTLEGWESTMADPSKLYYLWRHYLYKECSESLEVNYWPPPIHLQRRIKGIWL